MLDKHYLVHDVRMCVTYMIECPCTSTLRYIYSKPQLDYKCITVLVLGKKLPQ
jgi:hypothetical protein